MTNPRPPRIDAKIGLITLFTILAASSLIVVAGAGSEPGWRSGASRWNGSGYDLPTLDSQQLPQQIRHGDPPYVVPTVPGGSRINPYFQPNPRTNDSAVNTEAPVDAQEQPVSAFVKSLMSSSGNSDPAVTPNIAPAPIESRLLDPPAKAPVEKQPDSIMNSVERAPSYTEPAPLQEEVIRWYQYPQRWMQGWNSNAEFGIDGSHGNANTLAVQTGLELKRKTEIQTFAIDMDYRQASNRNATTENNGRLNIDYDRMIADTKLSVFGKYGMEWDQFKAFDLRLNLNSGLGYHWIREENASLVTRFGAGASREIGAPIDKWTPEAVFGIDAERQVNSRNKVRAKIDYFPAWENFNDYRLVADASWEILLDDTDNLSLKLAATDRYDSTPQGARPNDVYYSLLLLYKF